ncbi:TlyA family RNA methyltransferase [Fluviicola sp.]|jgi:23S rRNA (cytidine1920-2'-O)/16S rRNA (cytidine1409-2'-O)-methyltransferase|uniref:TlyA family RNA methyltransferase n=1 Tax=Fluviicola sp. TaxID=1917219 RepID=UPI002828EC06|nr:TlyA family RNA methyltransferase [Fluviicola sp.]MDR0802064.1 TlyA family RNA methyltransferase [Fluviicola sp.]
MEERLDKLLVNLGLVTSRARGEELIKNGDVLVNGISVEKPGKKIPPDARILLLNEELTWVSRGALKLLKAIDHFGISAEGKSFIDLGASTGGFTEVLLNKGAAHVYCVDVGHGQLHERIRENPDISNIEKTHIRELTTAHVPEPVDGIVIDVSFISLEKVLPFTGSFVQPGGILVALIKPQFELEKKFLNKHGVVKSASVYPEILQRIERTASDSHFEVVGIIDSPIVGGDGNKEFLLFARKKTDHSIEN